MSAYEDNGSKNFGGRWKQGGTGEEKDRCKVPGRTGWMKEKDWNQIAKGLRAPGRQHVVTALSRPGSSKQILPLPIPTCCGQHGFGASERPAARLINGFVSLIRLSDRTIYHLEDD